MAGALNTAAAAPGPAPTPSMAYVAPNGGGALSMNAPAPSYMPGVDPTLLALMNAPPGPESPYARRLADASDALIGDPTETAGALDSARSNYDRAVQGKMSAIQRAMARLTAVPQGQSNMPLLAAARGALQPTRTGSIGETIGNAIGAAMPEVEKQRQVERQLAGTLGYLDVENANTDIQGAQGDEGFLEKRLGLADKFATQAGNVQNRADMANYRTRQSVLQYAGRLGAAQIGANKNRFKFLGNDPQDGSIGRYMDQTNGQVYAGPAARGGSGSGNGGVSEWRYNIWLQNHPGDTAGAEDYAAGKRSLSPEKIRAGALSQASRELGVGADKDAINSRAEEITQMVQGGFDNGGDGGTPAPAPHASAPAPGGQNTALPPLPNGVPPVASYSPSEKRWWWQENGKWKHN